MNIKGFKAMRMFVKKLINSLAEMNKTSMQIFLIKINNGIKNNQMDNMGKVI